MGSAHWDAWACVWASQSRCRQKVDYFLDTMRHRQQLATGQCRVMKLCGGLLVTSRPVLPPFFGRLQTVRKISTACIHSALPQPAIHTSRSEMQPVFRPFK